jgi:hypothetical protein
MPELPGEPRLQLSEGCRACGGGAIRQKDFLGVNFRLFGKMRISFVSRLRRCCLPIAILFIVARRRQTPS